MFLGKYLIVAIDFYSEKISFQCFDLDFLFNEIEKAVIILCYERMTI